MHVDHNTIERTQALTFFIHSNFRFLPNNLRFQDSFHILSVEVFYLLESC